MGNSRIEAVAAKGSALSKPPNLQLLTWLVKQLATLAMARQANVDAETLKFFAVSLAVFSAEDLQAAINRLCHTKRAEGETAFPDLPTLEGAVIEERSRRISAIRDREHSDFLRYAETHRDEFVTLSEIVEYVKAKRAAAGKPMPELLKPGRKK